MAIKILIFSSLVIFFCSCKKKELSVVFVSNLTSYDTSIVKGKMIVTKEVSYLVDGYNDDSTSEKFIDSIVYKKESGNAKKYYNYFVSIFETSFTTSLEQLQKYGDRYSLDDVITIYEWRVNGEYFDKLKYQNGVRSNIKSEIIVQDIDEKKSP